MTRQFREPGVSSDRSAIACLWYGTARVCEVLHTRRFPIRCLYISQIWRSCDRASLIYSFKYNQQDATLYNILYYCQCCTRFGRVFPPIIRSSTTLHSIGYVPGLLGATAKVCEFKLTHASGNSKEVRHIPDAVCTVLSSWWWAETRPKHVERWR